MIETTLERLKEAPEHLKTQEMYDEAVQIHPAAFFYSFTVLKLKACVTPQHA